MADILSLGLPVWLAGGYGTPDKVAEALALGAAGVQVGTLFAYSDESGFDADVKAQIFAGNVIVSGGTVTGNIHAKNLIELEKEAKVRGDLETPSLKIEKGVIFVGSCRMENLEQGRTAQKPASTNPASPSTSIRPTK